MLSMHTRGPSRIFALEAADVFGAPVVFTIHGAGFDGMQHYGTVLAAVVCVVHDVHTAVANLCQTYLS